MFVYWVSVNIWDTFVFQFKLSEFKEVWQQSVPEGLRTSDCQLEVSV